MNRTLLSFLVTLLGASPLLAQIGITPKERIEQEVLEKKRLMREGKVIRTNVRVTVRLRNASRLRGVVKNERFIERVDGLSFVPTDLRAPGAGLRLSYADGTNSYIFLPYDSIQSHTIGERLTDDQVRAIAEQLEAARNAAREKARQKAAESDAEKQNGEEQPKPPAPPDNTAGPKPPAKSVLTPEQEALLKEFPPEEGWGSDRLHEIEVRKVTIGVYPDARSQRFLEVYAQWNEAYERRRAVQPDKPVVPPPQPAPKK